MYDRCIRSALRTTRSTFLSFAGIASALAAPIIQWSPDALSPAVELAGASREMISTLWQLSPTDSAWSQIFAVYAEQGPMAAPRALPPMAGTYRMMEGHIRFEPQFPWTRGVRYRAEFRPAGEEPVMAYFELPSLARTPSTTVARVFPSADLLPENQLKFYVEFSAPMSRGGVYDHIHLRDAQGKVIELAFLELDEELWDPAMRRLTLLIDPGRIKRGVKPLVDIGPVFEAGQTYSLAVDAACHDAEGQPLRASFEKTFRTGPPDRLPPDPARWKITPPRAETREGLTIDFDEPLDQALALRLITVTGGGKPGHVITGEPELAGEERQWTFVPSEPWRRGTYRLSVATTIEDLAGNNIGKAFDVDLFEGIQRRVETQTVGVAFEVK